MDKIRALEDMVDLAQNDRDRIDALNQLSQYIWWQDPWRTLKLLQEAQTLATKMGYAPGLAEAQYQLGRIFYRQAQYDQAQTHFLLALAYYQETGQTILEANVWTGLGLIHWRLADYPTAVDYHLKALELSREGGDKALEMHALANLGLVYGITKAWEETLSTYSQLLTLCQAVEDRIQAGFAMNNLAMAYWQMGDTALAHDYVRQSLQIAREQQHQGLEVLSLDTMGSVLLAQGEAEMALRHFQQSANLAAGWGYQHDQLTAVLNMGKAYVNLQQPDLALLAWQQALHLAESMGAREDLCQCYQQLAQFYKQQGDAATALAYYEQFHELDRAIYNEVADMRLKTLQVIHRTETTRVQNTVLEQEVAERKRVEASLRASQENLHTLIQASPDSIYFKDGEGRWVVANQAGLRVFQLEGVDYRGRTDADLADAQPFHRPALLYCARTDEMTWQVGHMTRSVEMIPQPGGSNLTFDVVKVPLFEVDGRRQGLVVLGRDVTAQYEAETALRQSEAEYKALYNMVRLMCDNVPDMIWAKDLDGRYLFTNQAICQKLLNVQDTNEPIGQTDFFFAQREREKHPENSQWHTFGNNCMNSDQSVLQGKSAQRLNEYGYVKGEFLYLDVYKAPFWNEQGEMIGTVGCGREVTAERQREAENQRMAAALQASEERLRLMVQYMPVMIDAMDSNGNIVFWNEECERVTGYSAAEIINNPQAMEMLYPDETYRQNMMQLWHEQGNDYRNWEWQITCKEGRVKTIAWSNISGRFPLPGWAAWGIGVDVTERERAETALRLAQKTESLGVLAGGVAHDFNNLLVAMLGQMSLALVKLRPESPARAHMEKAMKAAERAADLTQKMLAYSGRGHFTVQPLNLNSLIMENLHLFQAGMPKNVQLQSELAATLPLIDADAGQMQQVVMNLIINAVEAIGEQSGRVLVVTGVEEVREEIDRFWHYTGNNLLPGSYVTLEILDNGVGMSSQTLGKIFDPFFTTKQAGHGLGLAAVLGIIRGHRGGIRVYSESGQGTTFKLLFPVSTEGGRSVVQRTAVPPLHLPTPLVLVIDDEEPVREAITDILELEGIHTFTASDGQSGLILYQTHLADIDLVILDLSMPGLSGEETFRQLRRLNSEVRVLLSSGYNQVEATRRFTGKGLAGFIQKPYSADMLLQKIRELLYQS